MVAFDKKKNKEYKLKNDQLIYRYTNCNENFAMPIKTNWSGDKWLNPSTSWQSLQAVNKTLKSKNDSIDLFFISLYILMQLDRALNSV